MRKNFHCDACRTSGDPGNMDDDQDEDEAHGTHCVLHRKENMRLRGVYCSKEYTWMHQDI